MIDDIFRILQALSAVKSANDDTPPMVAFMCGKPSMYLADKGWTRDPDTDCLKNPFDILNYCKKVRVLSHASRLALTLRNIRSRLGDISQRCLCWRPL